MQRLTCIRSAFDGTDRMQAILEIDISSIFWRKIGKHVGTVLPFIWTLLFVVWE